jgi:hypothetical protein
MPLSDHQKRLASAFPEISWAMEDRVCMYRPEGVFGTAKIGRLLAWLGEIETDREQPFSRFTDLTKVHTVELSKLDLANAAFWRRSTYEGPIVKSAFLAHSDECLELAGLYAGYMQKSRIMVSVFRDPGEASIWLRVPMRVLGETPPS